jgi:glutamate-5-semialdehyde dehydrogenase
MENSAEQNNKIVEENTLKQPLNNANESLASQAAINAKIASIEMMGLSSDAKNSALAAIAESLAANKKSIAEANTLDLENARKSNLAAPLLGRLMFDEKKLSDVIKGLHDLIGLGDPVGKTTYDSLLDHGLELYRVTCPIGVIGVIFESRPDALVQISALCLKSGNAIILKGGSEAYETNRVLAGIINEASIKAGLPDGWISLLATRSDVNELLKMDSEVDLLIPRGSNAFVRMIMDNTKIPVLGHADGVCHVYIDESADVDMAIDIIVDAKAQYVSACNSAETILINELIAPKILTELSDRLKGLDVTIFGCDKVCKILKCEEVTDWHTEYLDLQISIKIVPDTYAAIAHINRYGSKHTDAIITENRYEARKFMAYTDSANVFLNCSTRFSDGFRYGFGAEVGISTSKIHARGPVGLEGLVTYKYKLFGKGQKVSDYAGGKSLYLHHKLNKKSPFDQ